MPTFKKPLPVSVVVLAWNSEKVLEQCLEAVIAECPEEIIVVDNGSEDQTPGILHRYASRLRIHHNAQNVGFAAGSNQGYALSNADFILFLNDDATLHPGYLQQLIEALEHEPRAASATGKLVYEEDGIVYIDSAGLTLVRYALRPQDRGQNAIDDGQFDRPREIFGATGAAALYRRRALETLADKPFDEELFAYYEDVDLAWRLGNGGFSHLYVPSATAEHRRRSTTDKSLPLRQRAFFNRHRVWAKNEGFLRFLSYAPIALPWEVARWLRILKADPALLRPFPQEVRVLFQILSRRLRQSPKSPRS
jgi:GT2 family glycosyltransferase